MCFLAIFMSSLEKCLFRSFAPPPFFTELYKLFVYFEDYALVVCILCNYFLPVHRLSFHFVYGFLCCAEVYKFD